MKQLLVLLTILVVLAECHLAPASAQSVNANVLRLSPSSLSITCNNGDIRVDANDSYKLKKCGSLNNWQEITPTGAVINPMTAAGDLIVGGASGNPGRLGIGATNTVLKSTGSASAWGSILNANIDAAAAIDVTKLYDGSVSNTEFSYINTLTENVQTSLSQKELDIAELYLRAPSLGGTTGQSLKKNSNTDYDYIWGDDLGITSLTGDISASGIGSAVATLPTVNSNVGSFGGASKYTAFTVNSKGLITAASEGNIAIGQTQVTNLVSDLAGKQATGNYITALTGDVTATGPGSVAATLATVGPTKGGTGLTSYTKGDLLYSSATNTLAKLGIGTTNQILTSSGSAPQWTSTLSIAQGGTNNGSLAVTAGGVLYTDGSKIMNVGIGTTGQFLTSQASSPPTWTTVAAKSTGEVFMTASTSCPTGSMAADGSSLLRSGGTDCGGGSCASLFSAISTTYGTVDGTHFTLPDLRGVFVRGQGTQTISAISYTGTQGTTEGDQFQGHRHMMRVPATAGGASLWGFTLWTASRSTTLSDSAAAGEDSIGVPITGTHGTPRYGSETRPANVVLKYCIVY